VSEGVKAKLTVLADASGYIIVDSGNHMSLHRFIYPASLLTLTILFMGGPSVAQDARPPAKPAKKVNLTFIPKITISKETTWATEPVGPNGFVDYLAVINREFSRGVTPENNAVVKLYQAMGPAPDHSMRPPEFFKLLGIEAPPKEGQYFEDLGDWYKRTGKALPAGGIAAVHETATTTRTRPWTAKEFPEIAEWLESNREPLTHVAEATDRTEYYSPFVSADGEEGQLIQILLPGVQCARGLARALVSRAMLSLGENDGLKAWTDLITVHRLGRLVGRGPTLIEGLVGIALESMATEAELRFLSENHPTAKFLARYAKQLEGLPPRALMADKMDHCERAMFLDCCQQVARGRMRLSEIVGGTSGDLAGRVLERILAQSVDWDVVLKSGNRWYNRMVTAARLPKYQQQLTALRKLEEELKQNRKETQGFGVLSLLEDLPTRSAFAAKTLMSLLLPATLQCIRAENKIRQRFQNVELAFALAAWHAEHGTYPEKLADLAPKFIPSVPDDLFTEQPLHYERTADGYRFYSVGENEKDDLGLTYGDGMGKDDLIVQMPMPLPKPPQ
jgi:hypothetical protein